MSDRELGPASKPDRSPPVKQPTDFRIISVLKRTRLVFARNFFNLAGIAGISVVPVFFVPARDGYVPVNLGLPTRAAASICVVSILLSQSIMCFVAFQRMCGQPMREGLKVGLHRSLPLVGITLSILLILGILLSLSDAGLAAAGAILLPVWSMPMTVCVIEGLGPLRGFGRSRELTKGHRWKMLALVLLAIVAVVALLTMMGFLVRAILSFGPPSFVGPVARINALTWMAVWSAFVAVLLTVSYHELRAAKGGNEADRLVEVFE
jgi:hypothetical protein